jgi:hypothetical protein
MSHVHAEARREAHQQGQQEGQQDAGPDGPFLDTAADAEPVVVRRNAGLAALVGAGASAVAIGYLWRATQSGAPLDWALCAVMAGIAAVHLAHLVDARTPLFVADELGVRIRLGNHWRGLPWDAVDEVVVQRSRGLLRDGRLVVVPHGSARALDGLDGRARRAAALNQRIYGAAIAVPISLTTRVSAHGPALTGGLDGLAHGRAEVVALRRGASAETPAPAPADAGHAADPPSDGGAGHPLEPDPAAPEPEPAEDRPSEDRPARRPRGGLRSIVSRVAEARGRDGTTRDGTHHDGPTPRADEPVEPSGPADVAMRETGRPRHTEASLPDADAQVVPLVTPVPVQAPVLDDFLTEPGYQPVIGPELAAARVRVRLSVDELAERTRIRPHVIESIEVDDFAPCGGDFYARGHLRTLARVLGRDPVPLLAQFDSRYATAPISARRVFEAELSTGMTSSMRTVGSGPNWGLLVGVVLALVMTWGVVRLLASEPPELLQSPAPVLNGSAGVPGAERSPAGAPPVTTPEPVRLTLLGEQGSSQVVVRDRREKVVWAGEIALGEERTVRAVPPLRVQAEEGGTVAASVDGDERGTIGRLGEPGRRTFDRPSTG